MFRFFSLFLPRALSLSRPSPFGGMRIRKGEPVAVAESITCLPLVPITETNRLSRKRQCRLTVPLVDVRGVRTGDPGKQTLMERDTFCCAKTPRKQTPMRKHRKCRLICAQVEKKLRKLFYQANNRNGLIIRHPHHRWLVPRCFRYLRSEGP